MAIFAIGLNICEKMNDKIVKRIIYSLFRLKYGSSLTLNDTLVRRCQFRIQNNGNQINLGRFRMFNSKFFLNGDGNTVTIGDTNQIIYGLSVKIYGSNNILEIKNHATIFGLRIVIRGEGCRVTIGEHFSENIHCMITCMGKENYILIGDDCMFSENIDIWNTDSHQIVDLNGKTINKNKPILIGNHVWIGKNCTILKGITIGNDSIIGMSSVVTNNVDHNSIYVGNPARKVKEGVSWNRNYAIQ